MNYAFTTAAALVLSSFSAAAPAMQADAASAEKRWTIVVQTNNLDLTTPKGQKTLRLRLAQRVSEICPIGAKCRAAALQRANAEADRLIKAATDGHELPSAIRVAF
jgi:UrcA family protein